MALSGASAPRSNKRIGELLVEQGLINHAQLERALAEQQTTREFLGAILVKIGAIQPDALLVALSQQSGIPHERLRVDQIDWTVASNFRPRRSQADDVFPSAPTPGR